MSRGPVRGILFCALVLAFVLRHDLWLWSISERWLGLPAGLAYHAGFCLVAAGLLALLVRFAWPEDLDPPESRR